MYDLLFNIINNILIYQHKRLFKIYLISIFIIRNNVYCIEKTVIIKYLLEVYIKQIFQINSVNF